MQNENFFKNKPEGAGRMAARGRPIEPTETIEPRGREFALIGRDFEFRVSANLS